MSNRTISAALVALVSSAVFAAPVDDLRVSGPFTHENLSVYLLHSTGKQTANSALTLGEAIAQKKAAVYETGSVQQLSIENLSSQPVFVQAGDIVKGGQQDRVLTTDLLLPPHSGKLPIASFCVEQGRWTKRGAEPANQFNASTAALPTSALKMAVREPGNQAKVWQEVAEARTKLAGAASGGAGVGAGTVGSVASESHAFIAPTTSMQMTLEDGKVNASIDRYIAALSKSVPIGEDAVGYAYTVNGKFTGAEVYASADLFRRMWPKLLHASAAEALAEHSKPTAGTRLGVVEIRKALAVGDSGKAGATQNNGSLSVTKKESSQAVLYVTTEHASGEDWVHKSYIAK